MKVREVIRILKDNGFRQARSKGSHRQFRGMVGGQVRGVTVPGKDGDEVNKATLASIKRQSDLPRGLFRPS